jgi:transposase InsO family protein
MGHALLASKPDEVLHMDYLFMGPSQLGYKYLLLMKDDLSGYLWLVPARQATASQRTDALLSWFAAFGVVYTWVTDRGSHFANQVIQGVCKALRARHHFTTAYLHGLMAPLSAHARKYYVRYARFYLSSACSRMNGLQLRT